MSWKDNTCLEHVSSLAWRQMGLGGQANGRPLLTPRPSPHTPGTETARCCVAFPLQTIPKGHRKALPYILQLPCQTGAVDSTGRGWRCSRKGRRSGGCRLSFLMKHGEVPDSGLAGGVVPVCEVVFKGEEEPKLLAGESCETHGGLDGQGGERRQQGAQGWWTEVGDRVESSLAIGDETGEAWQLAERRWDGDKSRDGGFGSMGHDKELAGEAQELTEVGTAIEIRRVRDTVIRTEWLDLSRVIYSPIFPPEILNRLKWFQMLSLFRTIRQNVALKKWEGWET